MYNHNPPKSIKIYLVLKKFQKKVTIYCCNGVISVTNISACFQYIVHVCSIYCMKGFKKVGLKTLSPKCFTFGSPGCRDPEIFLSSFSTPSQSGLAFPERPTAVVKSSLTIPRKKVNMITVPVAENPIFSPLDWTCKSCNDKDSLH